MPEAKLKQHTKSKPDETKFPFDKLSNGSYQVKTGENSFEIMNESDFNARFEAIAEAPVTTT